MMEPAAKKGREFDGWAQGLRRPLLGSAAGHVVLLAALSLLGAAAGPGAGSAVHVILVEGTQFASSPFAAGAAPGDRPAVEDRVPAPPGGPLPGEAARHTPTAASRRLSSPSVPGESPIPPTVPRTPAAVAGDAPTPPVAAPEMPPSGATVSVPSSHASGDPAPAISSVGKGTRANGDGIGVPGDVAATTAAIHRRGEPDGGPREGAAGVRADRAGDGTGTGPLLQKIRAAIVYPEEAIRRGQEGEVLLRIRIGEGGVPREIRVARSSGATTLDKAARDGVVRAAPLPSLPGWFEVPIRFSLH